MMEVCQTDVVYGEGEVGLSSGGDMTCQLIQTDERGACTMYPFADKRQGWLEGITSNAILWTHVMGSNSASNYEM